VTVVGSVEKLVCATNGIEVSCEISTPEWEKATEDERNAADVDRKVDCEERDSILTDELEKDAEKQAGASLLTEPPLGGLFWPEADSQSYWYPVDEAVGEPEATQGQTLGVTQEEVSLWVPLQGTGALSTVAVISGADWVEAGSAPLLPLTLPPSATIDFHVPLLSP
jgi:hypothetical protein